MVYVLALIIFLLVATATWAVGLAVYKALVNEPDPFKNPSLLSASFIAIALVTLASFVQCPWGYFLSIAIWGLAAKVLLEWPWPRAGLLFGILSVLSVISRLIIIGVLELTR